MTSRETLNEEQLGPYYPGSAHEFQPGELVDPAHARWGPGPAPEHRREVYFGFHPDLARTFGKHVYEVEPTGETDLIPKSGYGSTKAPMRVVRKV